MTPKEKDLLLRDLCARLPYGLKVKCEKYSFPVTILYGGNIDEVKFIETGGIENICAIKPYLFPLSSMTEEQEKEILKRYKIHTYYGLCIEITNHSEGYWDDDNSCNLQDYLWLVDWFNKNHFDYRGLIEKSLALDATGLNIY